MKLPLSKIVNVFNDGLIKQETCDAIFCDTLILNFLYYLLHC